jgi:cell wall-associated NlpC family hydrolase/3D (Asp-Asp-Asp) domain-containing protein
MEGARFLKLRNVKVAKRLGTKTLAGLLAFGLVVGTPSVVLADVQSTMSQSDAVQTEKLQAKSVDGRDTLTDVSDKVMDMIQKGEVKLDEESKYLIDTVTGKKVDPVTGERVEQIPANPDIPGTPDTPDTPSTPDTPDTPSTPDTPGTPDTPDTPNTPNTPNTPSKSEASGTSNVSGTSNAAGKHTTANNKQATDTTKKKDETKSAKSNKELIAKQKIVKLPQIKEDFRFFTVARNYAFAKTKINIREAVPENIDGSNTQTAGTDVANAKKDAEKLQKKIKTVKKDKKIKNKTVRKAKSKAVRDLQKAVEKQKKQKQEGMDAALVSQQLEEKVRTVGTLPQDGLLYILKEEENGWLYVESGDVRGFVKASEVYTDDAAQELLTVYQKKAQKKAKKDETEYNGIEGIAKTAKASVDAKDNQAYTYLRVTAGQTVAAKDTALINDQIGSAALEIKEEKNTTARTIGTMAQGQLCYILADKDSDWVYIESGDVRGFVEQKYLDFSDETKKQIEANGEDKYQTAKETVKPEENQALYYTLTSVKEGSPSGEIRESMLEFASQFIGNPYVWGGTSLTDGADCSGFVQQIYKQYGYSLPRVAEDQSQYGTKIPVEDAQPGDLIFYAKEGYVYHVVMYAGDGRTIEAASTKLGIIEGKVNTKNAVWATRILKDDYSLTGGGIEKANATEDMYGQKLENFQITYYCPCEICCDKASKVTASGTPVAEGKTIATDPNVIPYGTKVIIGGHVFTAEDTGRKVQGNQISIYVNNHAEVSASDTENTDVYLAK